MKKFFISILALSASASTFAIDYVVKGNADKPDGTKIIIKDYDGDVVVDSTRVENGRFKFVGSYDVPAYVCIETADRTKFANCVLDSLVEVDFTTNMPISGGSLTEEYIKYKDKEDESFNNLVNYQNLLRSQNLPESEFLRLMKERAKTTISQDKDLHIAAIEEHGDDGIGVAAILGITRLPLSPDEWYSIYSKMSPYLKNLSITEHYNKRYTAQRRSQPGMHYIDFEAMIPDGTIVKLSDYVGKGKYVLLDFWATWCGPCKEEAEKTLRPLFEKYKDDDRFMILGVGTWEDPERTLKGLEKLQYPWQQIIGAGKVPMVLYGFEGIPQIMLIDPDGKIVERDLRGENLVYMVDSILSSK